MRENNESCNSFVSFNCETQGGLHAGAVLVMNSIAIAAQRHGVVHKRYDIVHGLKVGVACAIQRGNRAGLVASAAMNAKYTHTPLTLNALQLEISHCTIMSLILMIYVIVHHHRHSCHHRL